MRDVQSLFHSKPEGNAQILFTSTISTFAADVCFENCVSQVLETICFLDNLLCLLRSYDFLSALRFIMILRLPPFHEESHCL